MGNRWQKAARGPFVYRKSPIQGPDQLTPAESVQMHIWRWTELF